MDLNTKHGWASDFLIDAVGAICEMLGASQIYGKNATLGELSDAKLPVATSADLRLLDEGPTETTAYLESLKIVHKLRMDVSMTG